MSTNVVPFNAGQMPVPAAIQQYLAQHAGQPAGGDLSQGVGVQFANVSYKGKVFKIKYGANETLLIDPRSNQPLQYLDVVIISAKAELSKTFYEKSYVEGTSEAPDCSSEDGVHPVAPPGKQPQAVDCRTCPWNAFGSKKSTDGTASNSKACADTRKVVIVPPVNMDNEQFGGPMLLRVPAASLSGLAQFDRQLQAQGVPYFAVIVRITFDYTVAYPKLQFQAMQYLDDAQFAKAQALRNDHRTLDILSNGSLAAPQNTAALPAPAGVAPAGMGAPQPMVSAPAAQPQPPVAPQPAYPPAPPAVAQPVAYPPAPPAPAQPTAAWGTAPVAQPLAQPMAAPTIPTTVAMQPPQFAPPPGQPQFAPPVQPTMAPQPNPQPFAAVPPAPAAGAPLPQAVIEGVDSMFG